MKANVGTVDRLIRAAVGLGILSLAFFGPQTPFGYVGAVFLLTSLAGYCPLYTVLGFSTCPVDTKVNKT